MLLEENGEIAPEEMKRLSQSRNNAQPWMSMVLKVKGYREQYCTGTRSVRSMNQGKLEVVKQEITRVSISILGFNELKWTGMGGFISDDHYID